MSSLREVLDSVAAECAPVPLAVVVALTALDHEIGLACDHVRMVPYVDRPCPAHFVDHWLGVDLSAIKREHWPSVVALLLGVGFVRPYHLMDRGVWMALPLRPRGAGRAA